MTWKQINASREIRLWVTTVIVPVALGAAAIVASNPELLDTAVGYVKKKLNIKSPYGEETI